MARRTKHPASRLRRLPKDFGDTARPISRRHNPCVDITSFAIATDPWECSTFEGRNELSRLTDLNAAPCRMRFLSSRRRQRSRGRCQLCQWYQRSLPGKQGVTPAEQLRTSLVTVKPGDPIVLQIEHGERMMYLGFEMD